MTTDRIKVRVRFQKLVTCGHCGCVFQAGEPTEFVARGASEEEARERAERKAHSRWGDVPRGPCPHCARVPSLGGLVSRVFPFGLTAFFTASGLALPVALALAGRNPGIQAFALFASAVALVSCVVCAGLVVYQPNRNLERNRRRVRQALDQGTVTIVQPGAEVLPEDPSGGTGYAVLIGILGLGAALCMLAAPIYRVSSGWDRNPHLEPEICGPGGELRMTFPDTITSLDSLWSGEATAELEVPDGNGKRIPLTASTRHETWGKYQIWTSGNRTSQSLWAKVRLPEDPALGGKQVKITVVMVVTCPVGVIGDTVKGPQQRAFENRQQRVERTIEVNIAPHGARSDFRQVNLIGTLTGSGIVFAILGLLMLSAAFDHKPRSVVTLKQLAATRDDSHQPEREELPPWKRGLG
jgi:hypothetical protein